MILIKWLKKYRGRTEKNYQFLIHSKSIPTQTLSCSRSRFTCLYITVEKKRILQLQLNAGFNMSHLHEVVQYFLHFPKYIIT